MRSVFVPFDDTLIERVFQPLIDVAAARFGVRCTALACLCLDAASLAWILSRMQELARRIATHDHTAAVLETALLLLGLTALVCLRTLFRRAGRQPLGNPLRLAMRPHRAVVLMLLWARLLQWQVPGLADVADLLMLVFCTAALYLGACAERPPVRRTWMKLADALTGSG